MDLSPEETAVVKCGTTKGPIEINFIRKWSPKGYDRAVELFENGYYDTTHFFRCIPNFLVQFGITYSEDEKVKNIAKKTIMDDPQLDPPIRFREGIVSFAGSGPNSRDSQLFIAYDAVPTLGRELWETPIGEVISGMNHVRGFYGGYGDHGPLQHRIYQDGREYVEKDFPLLDRFLSCQVRRFPKGNNHITQVKKEVPPPPLKERTNFLKGKRKSIYENKPFAVANEGHKEMHHSYLFIFLVLVAPCLAFFLFKKGNKLMRKRE